MSEIRRSPAWQAGVAALPLVLMALGIFVMSTLDHWHVPLEVYLLGTIEGALLSLIAIGFILVYRAQRIVNFAAADLGAAPATLAFILWASLGWNIYLSTIIGFGSAILLGVVVEFALLRPFFKAPRLVPTVVTIGAVDLLLVLSLYIPIWLGSPDNTTTYPPFINASFTIGSTPFSGSDLLVWIVVPVVLIGLAAFFRFTNVGTALKASAENADRAALLGIPVKRLQSVVWGIGGALAFIAIFLRIGVVGVTLGRVDLSVLLYALGAAVIGRMERMPTAVCAAVGIGIVDQACAFHFPSEVFGIAIIAAIIAGALLLQRAEPTTRLSSSATSTWSITREIKRIPAELRNDRRVRIAYGVLAAIAVIGLVAIPAFLPEDKVKLAGTIGIFAIIGLSLVLITGWAGQINLGQMGFVGISGAVAGTIAVRWHWDIALILIAAGAAGAIATVIVGLPTLRARGLAFAIVTLAFSLAASNYFLNAGYSPLKSWVPQGGVPRTHFLGLFSVDSEKSFYWLIVVVLAVSLLMMRSIRNSRIGRTLIGVRDNERAAEALAVGPRGVLVTAFAMSGFLAGMAGALFVLQQRALDASNFDPFASLQVFSMAVVGGLGSIGGAVLGALYLKGIDYFLTAPQWAFLSSGVGLIIILLIFPSGLGGALGDLRDGALRWYARRKHIRVPSLLADTRVDAPVVADVDIAQAFTEAAEHATDLVEIHE